MNYNLLDEAWIPVFFKNGKNTRVGIRDALAQAAQIRQIAATNPMDRLAILRFLLALLYWCMGNPPDDKDSISGDSFPSDWFKKLDENKGCFNLLGDGKRLYQSTGKSGKDPKLSANYLTHEVPTGTNSGTSGIRRTIETVCVWHAAPRVCCVTAFRNLRRAWQAAGRQSETAGICLTLGASLAETLRVSWRKVFVDDLGTPTWEKSDLSLPSWRCSLLLGLTWLPRRVWLDDPVEPAAPCISCGRRSC